MCITSLDPNGTGALSKNLHMTVRFHVVLRTYLDSLPYTRYICVCVCIQRDARRRKNARCVTGTKVCSRKRAPLSLPEYISVTAYRVCMKRFKYLNSFVRQIFFVARNSATAIHRDESLGIFNESVLKGRKKTIRRADLASITRIHRKEYFSFSIFPPPDSIRLPTNRKEEKRKGGFNFGAGDNKRMVAAVI